MKSGLLYRQLAALIFLAAFLAQTFSKAFDIADYYSNKVKYAANCENKSRPMMHCNGQCQLMKKLKEKEDKEQKNPQRKYEQRNEITLLSKTYFPEVSLFEDEADSTKYTPYKDPYYAGCTFDIFHPPRFKYHICAV